MGSERCGAGCAGRAAVSSRVSGVSEQGSPSPWPVGGLSFLSLGDSGLTVSFTRRVLLLPDEWLTEASMAS